ncbi:NAD synthetase [Synechocystis salina LEGE 06155]|nr:NAD synthetase [Synechocystis salina LEGE 06155]
MENTANLDLILGAIALGILVAGLVMLLNGVKSLGK